ncbi:MAG: PepSY domain-containing protein [Miltoncostaeaceae bacterium]
MTGRTKKMLGGGAAAVVIAVGAFAGIAAANGTGPMGDDDQPLTGQTKDRAVEAALASVGGQGTVTETEVGDDGAAYGVEIRLPDGSQVEVNLNEQFEVTGTENDDDGPGDQDSGNDG